MPRFTFGEFRKLVADYTGTAGKCADAPEVADFAKAVMQYLLFEGSEGGIRKLTVCTYRGCISLPPEVEVPIKVRIDRQVGEVWSKWGTFHSGSEKWDHRGYGRGIYGLCHDAPDVLAEDGALTPLAYELPPGGSIVGIEGACDEAPGASVIVQGKDITGRDVYTFHQGEQIFGEKLSIIKGQVTTGMVRFGEITGIIKPHTNGYVICWAVDPFRNFRQFLADWSPGEEKPLYRKCKLLIKQCPPIALVSMLCRVRLRDFYLDNDLTLFDNSVAIQLAAQRIQAEKNNDLETANYKRQATEDILQKESGYKRVNGGPVDVFRPLSGGGIRNII